MKTEGMVQEAGAASQAKSDPRAQLAQHLAQQPQSRRTFDKVMKALEVAGLALIAGYVGWAIYVSINWSVPQRITAVWFAFPVSVVVLLILIGVHAAGIRAFFPVAELGKAQALVTGSKAVGMGAGFAVVAMVAGAFWGAFAWGIWTTNWAILMPLTQIIVAVVGAGAVVAVVSDLYKRFFRAR